MISASIFCIRMQKTSCTLPVHVSGIVQQRRSPTHNLSPEIAMSRFKSAKLLLRQILDSLGKDIAAGIPVIGLEPSCVAVFRDDLLKLFPNDEQAKRLAGLTCTLGEFLDKQAGPIAWPQLHERAIVHGHCHQKAVMGMDSDMKILKDIGLDCTLLDSGCCGMAGSFGFKEEHYGISLAIGEQILLPKIREAAAKKELVVTDGFSCREQIMQTTGRNALHTAEVLQRAMNGAEQGSDASLPKGRAEEPVAEVFSQSRLLAD